MRPVTGAASGSGGGALGRLNEVQAIDTDLDRLKLDETSIPGDLRAAREERARLEAALARARDQHAAVRRDVNAADLELRDLSAKRDKARTDQRSSQGAKEQTQFENLIQQLSGRIEELEDTSLPLVERMEDLANDVAGLERELADLMPRLEELEGMDETRIAALREQHDARLRERQAIASELDPKLVREYDAVRRARKGVGLVPVRGPRCGGCNVQLPLNVQQRVRAGAGVVKCPSCGRILWSGD